MVIIYDGKNLAGLVIQLKSEAPVILTSKAQPQPENAIYYFEKNQDPGVIRDLPRAWHIEMEKFSKDLVETYPERIFTKDFQAPPLLGELYIKASYKALLSLFRYLKKSTRNSFGISGEKRLLDRLLEEGRADAYEQQPLHIILGQGGDLDRQLYIWEGSLEEIYDLAQVYSELPRYHYLLRRGLLGRSFHSQRQVHGRYLGRISRRGFSFEWKKLLALLKD